MRSLLIAVLGLSLGLALAQPQRHDKVIVVPTPGTVAVDGDLKDWDLSGAIECAFDESLRPRFTAKVAFMYDREALFIAAHVADNTPLVNRHDPKVEPNRGWDADALQVRLCSDPKAPYPLPASNSDRIVHLTIWHYTDRREAVLHVQYGMDYHGTRVLAGAGSGVAFRKDADGRGYTLEARVPWKLLNAGDAPPRAGDRIALVVQPLWGDAAGWKQVCTFNDVIRQAGFSFQGTAMWGRAIFSAKGDLPREERPRSVQEALQPLELEVRLPDRRAKSVSLAVFSADGKLVRTLPVVTRGQEPSDRVLLVKWDGLDDDGRPLPAGEYAVEVLTHRGIGQRYVASLHNAGNPPWRTDDGTGSWGGDHGPPIAATSDPDRVYLGWTISEAGWAIVALKKQFTPDGKVQKLWGQHQVLELGIRVTAMATDGERLFVAQDGGPWGHKTGKPYKAGVVLWEAKSGKPINFPFGKRTLLLSEWTDEIKPPELKTAKRLSIYHPKVARKRFWERLRDHDFGPQELGLNLLGIAVAGDTLYASLYLENKVVAVNWKTGKKLADFPVPHPVGLAVDKAGNVLVASGHGVLRLDPRTSKAAALVAAGLEAPWGLALDADGRIYVADCGGAMQVKVFGPQGKPVGTIGKAGGRPWVGRYDPLGMLRPAGVHVDAEGKVWVMEHDSRPKRVSVWSRDGKLLADLLGGGAYAVEGIADEKRPNWINVHHTLFDLDYRTGRSRTVATLIRPQMHGFQFTPDGGHMGRALRFRRVRGHTWLAHAGRGAVVLYRMSDDFVGQPVAAVGPGASLPLHGFTKDDIPAAVREDFWRHSHDFAFWWTDANGDYLVQQGELLLEKVKPFWGLYWGAWVDDDLTIWSAGRGSVWRVPVESWRDDDVPVYPRPSAQEPLFAALGDHVHSVMPDGDTVFVLEQSKGDAYGKGAKWQAVSRYALDGKRQWAYRRAWLGFGLEAPLARPGDVVGAMKFIGKATVRVGGLFSRTSVKLVAVNGYFGQFNILSGDGLWVASLCKDNRYGPKADSTTVWPENFSGFFFRNRNDGKVYLIAGDTDARVWEVTGLKSIRTGRTRFTLTPADHAEAEKVSLRRQGASTELAPLRLLTGKKVVIDGKLAEWDMKSAATINAGGGRGAKVALACDGERLFAAFDVRDDSPMKNTGNDFALLFKTGDACDLMLATDPQADPKRTQPAPGDVRLLFSVLDGKPVCVLYEPVARRGAKKKPRTFSSPTGALAFDRVTVLDGAKVAMERTAKGYTLEASVPLADIGFAPKPGLATRGDAGVIFSDPGGSRNVLRAYYANNDTAIVNDIPSEARLTPGKWGRLAVD